MTGIAIPSIGTFDRRILPGGVKTITVSGGNLFAIAARELGDATQWNRIAKLNGLSDPMLNGLVSLLIPNVDLNAGGGIAAQ